MYLSFPLKTSTEAGVEPDVGGGPGREHHYHHHHLHRHHHRHHQVLNLMLEADLDGNGTIEFPEFLELMKEKYGSDDQEADLR